MGTTVWRGLVPALVLGGALTGCSGAAEEDTRPAARASATAGPGAHGKATAASGGAIGAPGSACELPVTFDVAEDWKAEAVGSGAAGGAADGGPDGPSLSEEVADALLRQGPVTAVCEIDAKPAGNIGFLRVWAGEPADTDARAVLEAFVTAEGDTSRERYRPFRTARVSGVEVEYVFTSRLLDETKKERALAVTTAEGPVVLHLGGLDTEEHEQMLPAYELAKRTLRTSA
ncbi:lipoprotein [Streptomyces sp. NPDC005526]|uniref:lipoprotein n=1 Tax=Streptomyces sp. NPDC005526 TaxID=3156885 RepID=UPI0033A96608